MTVNSQFRMPGAFDTASTNTSSMHSGLFQPPSLDSPARPDLTTSTKRKRLRDDSSSASRPSFSDPSTISSVFRTDDALLSTPDGAKGFGHRTYTLAGQLDTPSGGPPLDDPSILGDSMYSDSDYRRALGSKRTREGENENDSQTSAPTPLFTLPAQPVPHGPGWGSFAFNTLGGVVGKVWDFCRAGAFRGFHAGGGKGFHMSEGEAREATEDDAHTFQHMPGDFPHTDSDLYTDSTSMEESSRPGPKRRQTDQADDLGRNWVIVNEPQSEGPRAARASLNQSLPRNRNQRPSVATGRRISTPRLNHGAQGHSKPSSRRNSIRNDSPSRSEPRFASSASYASPRSPSPTKIPAPSDYFSGSHTPSRNSSSLHASNHRRRTAAGLSPNAAPSFSHRRTHSGASTASNRSAHRSRREHDDGGSPGGLPQQSPRLDAEARHLAARRKMEERNADVRISAFNKQLEDMIRQGKEALGTTVAVEGGEGGWEDE